MEMHRPFSVITTNTVPFKMWNRNRLIIILTFQPFQSLKLWEIFVRWKIELRRASSPLSWNIDTDPNPKLCWPSRVVAREDNKYRDTQKILGLAYWLRSKRYALPAHCAFLMFWYPVDLHRFWCCQCTRSSAVWDHTSVEDNGAIRLQKAEIPRA